MNSRPLPPPAPLDWLRAPLTALRRRIENARAAAAEREARFVLDSFEPDFLDRMGLTREDLQAAMHASRARRSVD